MEGKTLKVFGNIDLNAYVSTSTKQCIPPVSINQLTLGPTAISAVTSDVHGFDSCPHYIGI